MPETARPVTAAELEKFPDDDYRYELVEGRVVRVTPVGFEHGRIVMRLGALLDSHLRRRAVPGFVVTEVGFQLASNPDTVRAPDLAFIRRDRVPSPNVKGFLQGAPDLAIEVRSPDQRRADVHEKLDEYLARGATIAVDVDPDTKLVEIRRLGGATVTVQGPDDILELDAAVPGFRCTLRELFE